MDIPSQMRFLGAPADNSKPGDSTSLVWRRVIEVVDSGVIELEADGFVSVAIDSSRLRS